MLVAAFIVMLGNVALVSPAHAFIYWTQSIPVGGTSWIARANLDGTGIDMKYLQASLGGTVAAANGYLYWTNPSAQTIGRADIRRGYTDQRFVQGTGAGVLGIVVGSSAMYWMRTTIRATLPTGPELTARIGRATIDGGNVDQNFITTNSDLYDPPADFAIGGPYLFWHWPIDDLLTDHLMRANLDGTGASVSIATFNSSLKDGLEGLTADTRQLYGVGYAGALIRMSFDGTTLSYGAPYVINRGGPMVVSGSHLYWQTENEIDGSVGIGVGTVAGAVLNNGLISHLSGSDKYGNSMRISSIAVDAFGPLAIRTLSLSPSAFSATPRGPSVSPATRRYGTSVTYTLPKQERVRFTVQRRVTGRMKHGRCVAPNLSGRHGTPCIRLDTVAGSFTRRRKAGVDRFRFTGRLAGRTLTPGSYRLLATPDADGSAAPPVTASFRISQ